MFGRATIRLGIGPHSSLLSFFAGLISAVADFISTILPVWCSMFQTCTLNSLKIQDAKKLQKIAIWTASHNFVQLYSYLRNWGTYRQSENMLSSNIYRKSNADTVTHASTNRAQRRLTSLIETNALPRIVYRTSISNHGDVCLYNANGMWSVLRLH